MISPSWSGGSWLFSLLLTVLLAGRSQAQPVELIALTDVWSYEQSGTDLGTAWRLSNYDDRAWPAGPGALTRDDTPLVQAMTGTVLDRQGTNGQFKITDYFRTRFIAPTLQPGWMLVASNLVDDGAVAYLNGVELFRLRMPSGEVGATTLASETIDVGREGVFVVNELSTAGLIAGENVLAVEVHQPYITSSDVALGLALFYAPQQPIAIVQQPVNRTVSEGSDTTLQGAVTGSLPHWQWFKDGAPIAGATKPTLSLNNATRADAAQYFVVISNDVSAVTSRVVSVTLMLDTQAPALVSAQKSFWLNVTFTEELDEASATNTTNFRLTGPGGTLVPIVAAYPFDFGIALDTGPLTPGFGHELFVTGVRDRFGNTIAPNSGVALTTTRTNVALAATWRYRDTGVFPGANWTELNFNDGSWPTGEALLYNDASLNLQPPGVRRTFVNVTNESGSFWTHYFRHRFTNTGSPVGARFQLSHYLDDGAVFYLNGKEMRRVNMPAGTIEPTTRASASATEGVFSSPVALTASNLLVGENVLAVEVHQFSLASPSLPDISFGVELTVDVTSSVEGQPRILSEPADLEISEGGPVEFRAQVAAAAAVRWLRNGVPIPDANRPTLNRSPASTTDHHAEFTLIASNGTGVVSTRAARLTVRPDTFAPRLLRAQMGTNTTKVVLTFTEPLDQASASVTDNYSITNQLGETLTVLSVTVTNATNVVLTTAVRTTGDRYVITVSGVRDAAAAANAVVADARIGIDYEIPLLTYSQAWRYNDSGTNLDLAWREPAYDDAIWPIGLGLLGFEDNTPLPVPILTTLPPPEYRGITYYFRTLFAFSGDPAHTVLRLRHLIDDGAVFFLNGQEIHRIRMLEGQNYQTVATQNVEAQIEGPFPINTAALVPGINSLAVEVHQNTPFSADVVFGAELVQAYPADPPGPSEPTLTLSKSGSQNSLSWNAAESALESADQLEGPWHPVAHPVLPYPISPTNSARFYRLHAQP